MFRKFPKTIVHSIILKGSQMDNLLKIFFFLFLGIFAMVFLVERFAKPVDESQLAKMSKWIIPLIAVLLVLQLIGHYFG